MRRGLFFLLCLSAAVTHAQVATYKSIEVTLLARWDKHADYTSRYFNRSYTNDIQLVGLSYGLSAAYKYQPAKHLYTKAGLGYYQLRVDELRSTTPFGILASARNIDYTAPDSTQPMYSTGKYHYNTISFSVGLGTDYPLKQGLRITAGADFLYYYTFSQKYHMSWDKIYKPAHARPLGIGVNARLGIQKQLRNIYLHPQVIAPIYQQIRGDKVFGEEESLRISKWFNGIGAGVSVGKYF